MFRELLIWTRNACSMFTFDWTNVKMGQNANVWLLLELLEIVWLFLFSFFFFKKVDKFEVLYSKIIKLNVNFPSIQLLPTISPPIRFKTKPEFRFEVWSECMKIDKKKSHQKRWANSHIIKMSPQNKRRFKINPTFYCVIPSFVTAISIIIKSHAKCSFYFYRQCFSGNWERQWKKILRICFFPLSLSLVLKRYGMFSLRTILSLVNIGSSIHAYLVGNNNEEKKMLP